MRIKWDVATKGKIYYLHIFERQMLYGIDVQHYEVLITIIIQSRTKADEKRAIVKEDLSVG